MSWSLTRAVGVASVPAASLRTRLAGPSVPLKGARELGSALTSLENTARPRREGVGVAQTPGQRSQVPSPALGPTMTMPSSSSLLCPIGAHEATSPGGLPLDAVPRSCLCSLPFLCHSHAGSVSVTWCGLWAQCHWSVTAPKLSQRVDLGPCAHMLCACVRVCACVHMCVCLEGVGRGESE